MNTSQTTSLSKPRGESRVLQSTLNYINSRNRHQAYDLVVGELKKHGVTNATLARRLDKGPDRISRLLKRPGNWTLNTLSELVFAISGGALKFTIVYPAATQNQSPELEAGTNKSAEIILFGPPSKADLFLQPTQSSESKQENIIQEEISHA